MLNVQNLIRSKLTQKKKGSIHYRSPTADSDRQTDKRGSQNLTEKGEKEKEEQN